MNTMDYQMKIEELLELGAYKKLQKDPTAVVQQSTLYLLHDKRRSLASFTGLRNCFIFLLGLKMVLTPHRLSTTCSTVQIGIHLVNYSVILYTKDGL